MIIFIWGLPGSGKSTVGHRLSEHLEVPFYEMDDYLPESFKSKMKSGELITDEDRNNFFSTFTDQLRQIKKSGGNFVVSGYVAKQKHRDMLKDIGDVTFIELVVKKETLINRLENRKGHFFEKSTLEKVLENYEPLSESVKINGEGSVDEVVQAIAMKTTT